MTTGLYWFRNDLRVDDNPALSAACEACDRLLLVTIVPSRLLRDSPFGFPRIGRFRARFLRESIEALSARVAALGSTLLVATGTPADILDNLLQRTGAKMLWYQDEPGSEEAYESAAVARVAQGHGVRVTTSQTQTLYHPDDLPFSPEQMPDLFTTFRKALEAQSRVRPAVEAPTRIPAAPPLPATRDTVSFGFPDSFPASGESLPHDPRLSFLFRGGERAARERMDRWIWEQDRLRWYKESRNGLLGADYSSRVSPWLANGSLSPRRVAREIARYEDERFRNDSTYWLFFELIWRDYFSFLLRKYGRRFFLVDGPLRRHYRWSQDCALFDRWRTGSTGQPFIDANMRELAATGFMSNRGRQNVASYLARNLGIDWRMGAEWFESLLLDYDPASNWGNWNYVVGVGTDPRRDRFFDPERQAERYDPQGTFRRHWLAASP